MAVEDINVNNTEVQMVMAVKLLQLRRELLPELRYSVLEEYLEDMVFSGKRSLTLSEATDCILAVRAEDIVRYGNKTAKISARKQSLGDLFDSIEGASE